MWELDYKESWALKKNWCFWTVVLEKTLVPWTARRSNQSILKKISPEYSLEGLMLKLKLQYFGHLMWELTHWKRPWCWERLKAVGKGDARVNGWMASLTRWTWVWPSSGCWWMNVRETWHSAVHGVAQNELNSSKQHCGAKSAKFCQLQKFSWGWLPWIYWGTITIISLYSACMTDQLMKLQSPRLKASTHY